MRYRELDANGDYTFGRNGQNWLVNSPAAVGQLIETTLKLFQGEWFLDLTKGVPWLTAIIGYNKKAAIDQVLQNAIRNVQGVLSVTKYFSEIDTATRALTVTATVQTIYGTVSLTAPASVPNFFGFGAPTFDQHPFGV
jgi:hypothetical protein